MNRTAGGVRPAVLVAVGAVALVVTVLIGYAVTGATGADPGPSATPTRRASTATAPGRTVPGRFTVGVGHDQASRTDGAAPAALARARAQLRALRGVQTVRLMGWGTDNPEPSPGRYDWASLDRRIAEIARTDGIPVVVLFGAPDWMKGGRAGHTDWDRLADRPDAAHFRDFAALAVALARRHPEVRYFQVWRGFENFWNEDANRWDQESYTALYNTVYDALRKQDPAMHVGGPDMPVEAYRDPHAAGYPSGVRGPWGTVDQRPLDALGYWLAHKHGAQFLTLGTELDTRDGYHPPTAQAVSRYGALSAWIRARTSLPVWWSVISAPARAGSALMTPASLRAALTAMRDGGARVAVFDGPQCEDPHQPCLWTDTRTADGGRPTDLAPVLRAFAAG